MTSTATLRGLETQLLLRLDLVHSIALQVDLIDADGIRLRNTRGWPWAGSHETAQTLLGALQFQARKQAILGVAGPQLAAARLHAWVWDAAAQLWDDGHRRAAVQKAAASIDVQLQAKLGRYDTSGKALVSEAFTLGAPAAGRPRLRFQLREPDDSEAYKSAHEGAMYFGMGCFLAIRNPATHDPTELDEQVALERLAALSVLARWIDDATVVRDSSP